MDGGKLQTTEVMPEPILDGARDIRPALEEGNLAQNVRRLAGMHLASMEKLARYVGISRPAMQAIVAHHPKQRSLPRAQTVTKIAEAFGVSTDALYREPYECLREALEHFKQAPIQAAVDVPFVSVRQERLKRALGRLGTDGQGPNSQTGSASVGRGRGESRA
jgi:transcriptional regulator with XRE-family HTH domain